MLRAQSEIYKQFFFSGHKGVRKSSSTLLCAMHNDIESCTHQISSMGNATLELLNCIYIEAVIDAESG